MSPRDIFEATFDVSRETMARFDVYAALLTKWNKVINLVSYSTIPGLWERHLLDCAQIFTHRPENAKVWADLGSGAGLPGLVIAILAAEFQPELQTICIESDQRKAVFLQTVIRELDLNVTVMAERIENAESVAADVVSARALAPLPALLPMAKRHLKSKGTAVFLKGAGYLTEVEQAKQQWAFDIETIPSKTDKDSAVLILGGIRRA